MNKTAIEWTDLTWNPVSGCTKVSPGCANCYAEKIAHRFAGSAAFPEGFKVTIHPERLDEPVKRRKATRIFVNSMSDLFHPDVPFEFIDRVFAVMAKAERHTFQVLTKRPERMEEYFADPDRRRLVWNRKCDLGKPVTPMEWPLTNVWLGVSVEDQQRADERMPLLLQTPAAIRFVSLEPLLEPVDLSRYLMCEWYAGEMIEPRKGTIGGKSMPAARLRPRVDWLIVGAETGQNARQCRHEWAEGILVQAYSANVPIFIKDNLHWASRIQEWPEVTTR